MQMISQGQLNSKKSGENPDFSLRGVIFLYNTFELGESPECQGN